MKWVFIGWLPCLIICALIVYPTIHDWYHERTDIERTDITYGCLMSNGTLILSNSDDCYKYDVDMGTTTIQLNKHIRNYEVTVEEPCYLEDNSPKLITKSDGRRVVWISCSDI